jgi:predicted flavoprotein YhiN
LSATKIALLHEVLGRHPGDDPVALAHKVKRLPLVLRRPRPVAEAISTAGGVRLEALDRSLMLHPGAGVPDGVFCAGEMLDWEAPTGGYLLTACLASGKRAGLGAVEWIRAHPPAA